MRKKYLLLVGGLGLSLAGVAQRLSPSVLAVSGGTATTKTMTLDWTLGETFAETGYTPERLYTQGFHQPLLQVSELQNLINPDAGFTITVAPNPVTSYLTVGVTAPQEDPLQLWLTDLNGRQYTLPILPATTPSTQVDMTPFPAGTYLLHINSVDGRLLKSYKLIKVQ